MTERIPRYITAKCPCCDGALVEVQDNLGHARAEHGWVAYAPYVHGPLLWFDFAASVVTGANCAGRSQKVRCNGGQRVIASSDHAVVVTFICSLVDHAAIDWH